jgi:hypothetical protein
MIDRIAKATIKQYLELFPAVGIVGARQVGKTTLAKAIAQESRQEVVYLDLEDFRDYQRIEADPLLFFEQNQEKTIIIDEVQRMLTLFPMLRSAIDRHRTPARFILLGSASPTFLAKSTETLAGRIAYCELTPVNVREALAFGKTMQQHWMRGGFPTALLLNKDEQWRLWQSNFLKTYVDSDLRLLGLNAQPLTISRLLRVLSTANGKMVSYTDISNVMDLASVTVKNYLDFLENSFVIRRLYPYFVNLGKRLVKTPKLYFRDSGILHQLLTIGSYTQLLDHIEKGTSWEGYVIEQIISQLNDNAIPYFYRTQHGAELDLVIEKNNQIIAAIEVKLSDSPALSKGNHQAVEDLNCKNNFILTFSAGDYTLNPRWRVCDLTTIWKHLERLGVLSE